MGDNEGQVTEWGTTRSRFSGRERMCVRVSGRGKERRERERVCGSAGSVWRQERGRNDSLRHCSSKDSQKFSFHFCEWRACRVRYWCNVRASTVSRVTYCHTHGHSRSHTGHSTQCGTSSTSSRSSSSTWVCLVCDVQLVRKNLSGRNFLPH
jgi:hypothetical protein